jgi:hypothetical protein
MLRGKVATGAEREVKPILAERIERQALGLERESSCSAWASFTIFYYFFHPTVEFISQSAENPYYLLLLSARQPSASGKFRCRRYPAHLGLGLADRGRHFWPRLVLPALLEAAAMFAGPVIYITDEAHWQRNMPMSLAHPARLAT